MPRNFCTDTTNWPLKVAICRDSRPQYAIAMEVGRSDAWLSRCVHGLTDPSPEDRARIAEVLGLPESHLFSESSRSAVPVA